MTTTTKAVEIDLDPRRRTTVKPGRHSRYLVTEEPDGTLIWRPAVTMTEDERILHDNPWLVEQIERTRSDPSSRTRRTLPPPKD